MAFIRLAHIIWQVILNDLLPSYSTAGGLHHYLYFADKEIDGCSLI